MRSKIAFSMKSFSDNNLLYVCHLERSHFQNIEDDVNNGHQMMFSHWNAIEINSDLK